jgi:SRSO17 transposase
MEYQMDRAGELRLGEYFELIGEALGNKKRKASFATYAMGLMGDSERKSAEPMAARACPDVETVNAAHARLTYFTRSAEWSDRDVRRIAARYAVAAMTKRTPVQSWVIDDTGFLKQGKHSVGVQRQYTGSAGKVTNSQIGVSLTIATAEDHVPVDFELYLPENWTTDRALRREVKIPEHVVFKTKWEQAIDMITRAANDGLPSGLLLADAAYGNVAEFRQAVRRLGMDYAVGISNTSKVWRLDSQGRIIHPAIAIGELASSLKKRAFKKVTWKQGTSTKLSSRFSAARVVLAQDDGDTLPDREVVWLVMEWLAGEKEPSKFSVATLPDSTSLKHIVYRIKERWRTERVYEDAKGELGLDHYEGRSFNGWNHHVSVVLACFAFIVAERVLFASLSAIPPCAENDKTGSGSPLPVSTSAALPKLVYHHPPRRNTNTHHMATPLSALPSSAESCASVP